MPLFLYNACLIAPKQILFAHDNCFCLQILYQTFRCTVHKLAADPHKLTQQLRVVWSTWEYIQSNEFGWIASKRQVKNSIVVEITKVILWHCALFKSYEVVLTFHSLFTVFPYGRYVIWDVSRMPNTVKLRIQNPNTLQSIRTTASEPPLSPTMYISNKE